MAESEPVDHIYLHSKHKALLLTGNHVYTVIAYGKAAQSVHADVLIYSQKILKFLKHEHHRI